MQKRRLYKIDSEDAIQANFFGWLAANTPGNSVLDLWFSIPNGGYRPLTTGRRMKATGQKKGVPDCFFPVANKTYHGLWIEFKSEKGVLTEEQKIWIARLRNQYYSVHICRSWTEAAQVVIDYLGLDLKV